MVAVVFVVGTLVQLQIVYLNGFVLPPDNPSLDYIQNRPVLHLLTAPVISYVLILVVSFVMTYIPASKVVQMNPTDALRDE